MICFTLGQTSSALSIYVILFMIVYIYASKSDIAVLSFFSSDH